MASRKTKTIEEIDDLSDMFRAMAALGISCKGLQTLDQMKTRVREELNQSVNKPSWTAGQVRNFQKLNIQMYIANIKQEVFSGTRKCVKNVTFT